MYLKTFRNLVSDAMLKYHLDKSSNLVGNGPSMYLNVILILNAFFLEDRFILYLFFFFPLPFVDRTIIEEGAANYTISKLNKLIYKQISNYTIRMEGTENESSIGTSPM